VETEITKTVLEQMFHSSIFWVIYGAALVVSIETSFEFGLFRKMKQGKDKEWLIRRLIVGSGFVMITYMFYIMSFQNLDYFELNLTALITFLGFVICGILSIYDQWRIGQKRIDQFM